MAEARDFIMARLGAARAYSALIAEQIDECLSLFIEPDEDRDGKERIDLLESISEVSGLLSRAVETAQTGFETLGKSELREGEPDLPEGEEFDEEEDDVEEPAA